MLLFEFFSEENPVGEAVAEETAGREVKNLKERLKKGNFIFALLFCYPNGQYHCMSSFICNEEL